MQIHFFGLFWHQKKSYDSQETKSNNNISTSFYHFCIKYRKKEICCCFYLSAYCQYYYERIMIYGYKCWTDMCISLDVPNTFYAEVIFKSMANIIFNLLIEYLVGVYTWFYCTSTWIYYICFGWIAKGDANFCH